jgi:hypothetical protein
MARRKIAYGWPVRAAVDAEAVEPLELKGKAEPVEASRLLAVTGEAARRHEAAMVGRETELKRLRAQRVR